MPAYITAKHYDLIDVRDYLIKLAKPYSSGVERFIMHIYASMSIPSKGDRNQIFIPIPAVNIVLGYFKDLYQKHNENESQLQNLLSRGIIGRTDYSKKTGKCFEYYITNYHRLKLSKIITDFYKKRQIISKNSIVNIFTGKPKSARGNRRNCYSNKKGKKLTFHPFIKEAVNCISYNIINLEKLTKTIISELEKLDITLKNTSDNDHLYLKLSTRINYLHQKLITLLQMKERIIQHSDGNTYYKPTYKLINSGRIYEIHGGLQNISKSLKKVNYSDIPNVYNYDIQSSQIVGLASLGDKFGINTDWLWNYANNKNSKRIYADKVGIRVGAWKECLYSIIFGANTTVPPNPFKMNGGTVYVSNKAEWSAPYKVIAQDVVNEIKKQKIDFSDVTDNDMCQYYKHKTDEKYGKFLSTIQPLLSILKDWYQCLQDDVKSINPIMKNPCGTVFPVKYKKKDGFPKNELKSLSSFYLQGLEAAMIHHVTILSKEFNYTVHANEHDGLITTGEIPEEAIDIARQRSGFEHAKLIKKPF